MLQIYWEVRNGYGSMREVWQAREKDEKKRKGGVTATPKSGDHDQ